ncbi:MAG: hypothetical protein VX344_04945 [Bacteroidota bacterium]|nr:hypothetical protein [Bacteroidota bacterium]
MTIKEVQSQTERNIFNRIPFDIYKDDNNWIPHLEKDIEGIFSKKENKFFRHGEAVRWILMNENGQYIGRTAAFINKKKAFSEKQPTGGVGFFECINDESASTLLFDTAKKWLEQREMKAMDGPINFGERDRFWGLLVEGFANPPIYANSYQPPYYQKLFENYGFKTYFEQYMFYMNVADDIPLKVKEKSNRLLRNKGFTFKHLERNKMYEYAEDFRIIYNTAWKKHDNFKGMPSSQARAIMRKLKPIMDEQLIWFAYYESEPIAFFIALPELNQIFKHLNGKLNTVGKIKFLYHKWMGTCDTAFGIAFGVSPKFQKKGVEAALIMAIKRQFDKRKKDYKKLIITWVGDFNPKMLKVIENLGAEKYMTLKTYRKLFDPKARFERCKTI